MIICKHLDIYTKQRSAITSLYVPRLWLSEYTLVVASPLAGNCETVLLIIMVDYHDEIGIFVLTLSELYT